MKTWLRQTSGAGVSRSCTCTIFLGGLGMERKEFQLGDVVEMKKPHPCGTNAWKIIRMGMDIRIKCTGCQHSVLIPRAKFEKRMKRVIVMAEREDK